MLRGATLALALLGAAGAARAATPEDFTVTDTSDLIALCSAVPGSENYVAAINFCHGYAIGAFQYYQVLEAVSPSHRFVCLKEPRPTRDQILAAFIDWAQSRPQHQADPAVETLFRFLAETYPCGT